MLGAAVFPVSAAAHNARVPPPMLLPHALAGGVDASAAERQFARFAAFYQGDVNEPRPLFAREAA